HARAKSQPGLGTGRNGKGQTDHAKDGNCPGLHARSPADCRTLLNGRVWQSSQADGANFAGFNPRAELEIESAGGSLRLILIVRRLAGPNEAGCGNSIGVAFLPQKIAPRHLSTGTIDQFVPKKRSMNGTPYYIAPDGQLGRRLSPSFATRL